MKFASFEIAGRAGWGVVEGDVVAELTSVAVDLCSAIAAGALAAAPGDAPRHSLANLVFLPVIPKPDKIICVGVNYVEHRNETGRSESAYPTIFTRFANSQVGHGAPIIRPTVSSDLDYEGELAVIIGKAGRNITAADAAAHIAGYACYNDATVRDWQRHTSQFTPGKNFAGTGGFGPWMVTPDETGVLAEQFLRTRVNGVVLQEAQLRDMIFGIPALIAYCSTFTRLEPGDVIVTGTPGGVGSRRSPPLWLKPGDVVEVEIEGVGVLKNIVTGAPAVW